jgi:hypothetical protein
MRAMLTAENVAGVGSCIVFVLAWLLFASVFHDEAMVAGATSVVVFLFIVLTAVMTGNNKRS